MKFYTVILRKSAEYWVALCLENGLVGQGNTPDRSIDKLKAAIESFQEIYETKKNIYLSPICIEELHEFLTVEDSEATETYELRKVYAKNIPSLKPKQLIKMLEQGGCQYYRE